MPDGPSVNDAIQWLGGSKGFKLGKGVVGKTGQVAVGVVALWALLIYRMTENLVLDLALGLAGITATLFAAWYVRSTQHFAEKNPAQALLEGAEIIAYKQMEMAAAGIQMDDLKRVGDSKQEILHDGVPAVEE